MRVTVFGATGKTGTLVQHECLRRGWTVRAFARDTTRISLHPAREIIQGDARSLEAVERGIAGADAVFCCLGMNNIAVPATDFSDSVKQIVRAMELTPSRRLLAIAWAGVLAHPTGGYRNKEGVPQYLRHVSAEHVRNYETLKDSSLDWTLMCPVFLKGDIPVGRGRFEFEDLPPGSNETGYADLAHVMVQLVSVSESNGKRVGVVSDR
jgi:putative NADH-flavin reductase